MGFLINSGLDVSYADNALGKLFTVISSDAVYRSLFSDAIFHSMAEGAAVHKAATRTCELALQSREEDYSNSGREMQKITSVLSLSFGMESDIFLDPGEPGIDSLFEYTRGIIRLTDCLATVNGGVSLISKFTFGRLDSIAEPGGSFAISRMTITMAGKTPVIT